MSQDNGRVLAPVVLVTILLAGCNFGRVTQGRVIAYDKGAGVMSVVRESDIGQKLPKYAAPPMAVKVPTDPDEMGPAPGAGKLLQLNLKNQQISFYDTASGSVQTFRYTPLSQRSGVKADDAGVTRQKLPLVDRQKKSVMIYSRKERTLLTFVLPDDYLGLPDETWKAGDEVRYYYKDPGQALRVMNVSKTDLNKAEK